MADEEASRPDPVRLSVAAQAAALRTGELSAVELLEAHLRRIAATDALLHAWIEIDDAGARAAARRADERIGAARSAGGDAVAELPSLLGIPVGLKDLISVEGRAVTAGSRILAGYVSPYDAHIVERLRDAGAVLVGRTNMDEFAMGSSTEHSAYGPTRNPWDPERVPGGSSGGSAAAVASFQVPIAIGTDTGGSVRQPAALTGIVGLKPTWGRVSRYGIIAFASSLDQVGPLGRDVADVAATFRAIAGRDERDATSSARPLPAVDDVIAAGDEEASGWLAGTRLGVPRQYIGSGVEAGVEAAVRATLDALEDAGARLVEIDLPHTEHALATYYVIAPAEASANLARYDGIRFGAAGSAEDVIERVREARSDGFGAEVKRRVMLGTYALSAGYRDAYYLKAQQVRTLIRQDFDAGFERVDAIVGPVSPTVAFALGSRTADPVAMYEADRLTVPVSVAGIPAISVPCGLADGLPVGLHIIGRAWDDDAILRIARGVEAATRDASWRAIEPPEPPGAAPPA